MSRSQDKLEQIELFRGGTVVSSLAGSFGLSLRETRLTALLGYLIALKPDLFIERFGFRGKTLSVSLETIHEKDRSDILVTTTEGKGVIEAKLGATNPLEQSLKYPADWRVLLSQYIPSEKEKKARNTFYLRWSEIGNLISLLSKSSDMKVRFVSNDLLAYLEEHRMIKTKDSVEIYAREINSENTLLMYLRGQMYCCKFERNSRLPEALYFAPHFGQRISNTYPGVNVGITYISKIEEVEVVTSWAELLEAVRRVRGRRWLNSNRNLLSFMQTEWDRAKKRSVLFLGCPRLAFNPSVKKERLQKGSGYLSKRFLSFDELFSAWSKGGT